jgi:hypothetical protein
MDKNDDDDQQKLVKNICALPTELINYILDVFEKNLRYLYDTLSLYKKCHNCLYKMDDKRLCRNCYYYIMEHKDKQLKYILYNTDPDNFLQFLSANQYGVIQYFRESKDIDFLKFVSSLIDFDLYHSLIIVQSIYASNILTDYMEDIITEINKKILLNDSDQFTPRFDAIISCYLFARKYIKKEEIKNIKQWLLNNMNLCYVQDYDRLIQCGDEEISLAAEKQMKIHEEPKSSHVIYYHNHGVYIREEIYFNMKENFSCLMIIPEETIRSKDALVAKNELFKNVVKPLRPKQTKQNPIVSKHNGKRY